MVDAGGPTGGGFRPAAEFKLGCGLAILAQAAGLAQSSTALGRADLRTSPVRPRIRVDARRAARLERFCELGLGGRLRSHRGLCRAPLRRGPQGLPREPRRA